MIDVSGASLSQLGKVVKWIQSYRRLNAVNTTPVKVSAQLKSTMCSFQLDYTVFQFTASQLHKSFKDSLSSQSGDTDEKHGELTEFIDAGIKLSCQNLAEELQKHFCDTRDARDKPRVGIHAVDANKNISPLFITDDCRDFQAKKMADYTPFQEILASGTPYLENNIPKLVCCTEDYKHSGFDLESIREKYKCSIWSFSIRGIKHAITNWLPISRWNRSKKRHRDAGWNKVATVHENDGTTPVYKSHLIIPITFRAHANKIPPELLKVLKLRDNGRSILGFIAIDHPTAHYFDNSNESSQNNIDVNVAFIVADMLSLVRITEFMYTSGSKSYEKFNSSVDKGE